MVNPNCLVDVAANGVELQIPLIIDKLFHFIQQNIQQGIFRVNGSTKKVNQYYASLSKVDRWLPTADVYDVCSLLKRVLNLNYRFIDVSVVDVAALNTASGFNWSYLRELAAQMDRTCLHLFVYVLNTLSTLIEFSDVTKMSVLNYSIIFQPILFACDNLIELPHYINVTNYLLQNVSHLNANDLLSIPKTASSAGPGRTAPLPAPPKIAESNFLYMFKNFKNKSIDSINETLRIKVPSSAVKPSSYTPVTAAFPSHTATSRNYTFSEPRDDQSRESSESVDPLAPLTKALDQSIERNSIVSQEDDAPLSAKDTTRFNLVYDDLSSYISQSSLQSLKQADLSYDTTVECNDQELDIKPHDWIKTPAGFKPPRLGITKSPPVRSGLTSAETISPKTRSLTHKAFSASDESFLGASTPHGPAAARSSPTSTNSETFAAAESSPERPPAPQEPTRALSSRRDSILATLPGLRVPRGGTTDFSKRKSFIGLFKGDTSLVKRSFTLKLKSKSVY